MAKSNAERRGTLAKAAGDLASYGVAVWPLFEMAPHHRAIVEALEAVERGQTDRLMIFMPPRHGKSLLASTVFPSWYLGRHPDLSIIASSYGQELASDFGRRVRGFVTDPVHSAIFPHCIIADDSNAVHRFALSAGGNYFAVGAGGPITGRGANLLLIDDAIKSREEAYSSATRRSLQSWYETTAYTRLAPGGAIILISTRWHADDLPGWLLREHAREGWKVLSLPAIAEPKDPLGRAEGAALWPAKFPLETLDRIREAVGSAAWLSLYQQRPVAEEGAIFQRGWWRTYREAPEMRRIVFSLDTAFKATQSADYSVLEVWGESANGYVLLHVWRARAEFPELKRQAIALAKIWRPHAILVEDAASGQSLIQALKAETHLPILPVRPLGDKTARASAVSPLVESGRVFLPETAPWLAEFMDELSTFPAAVHDDQADALSQALNYLRGEGSVGMDAALQTRLHEAVVAARRARDGVAEGDRLFANGADLARAEDGAHTISMRRRSGGRWSTW